MFIIAVLKFSNLFENIVWIDSTLQQFYSMKWSTFFFLDWKSFEQDFHWKCQLWRIFPKRFSSDNFSRRSSFQSGIIKSSISFVIKAFLCQINFAFVVTKVCNPSKNWSEFSRRKVITADPDQPTSGSHKFLLTWPIMFEDIKRLSESVSSSLEELSSIPELLSDSSISSL